MGDSEHRVLCPVCEAEREIHQRRNPPLRLYLGSIGIGLGVALTLGILFDGFWGAWGGLLSWVLSFLGLETYYTLKFRGDLTCPVCRFDPILYKRSPEVAKQRCLERLKMQEEIFAKRWRALNFSKELREGS